MANRAQWAALGAAVGTASLGTVTYARRIEPRNLRTRHVIIGIPGLSSSLDGLSIAYLSDFHVGGPGYGDELTRRAIEITAQEQPDLVLLGGDYYDKANWGWDPNAFDGLAKFEHCFGVLGNHDHRRGEDNLQRIIQGLEGYGVCILRNETVSVRLRDYNITLAGVDDPYLEKADLDATLSGQPDPDGPLVLLAHAPVITRQLKAATARLVLCGHTHGGQIRVSPFDTITPLDTSWYLDEIMNRPKSKYQRGFHWIDGNLLYVSNGIGTTRWGVRFLAPPEIVIFHLTPTEPHPEKPCDSADRYVETIMSG